MPENNTGIQLLPYAFLVFFCLGCPANLIAQEAELTDRVASLEKQVAELKAEVAQLKQFIATLSGTDKTIAGAERDSPESILRPFLSPTADHNQLAKQLRPTRSDYDQLFTDSFADAAFQLYDNAWENELIKIRPHEGQTELLLGHLNSNDLREWNEKTDAVPGGYKSIAKYMVGDFEVYSFKFVEPGRALGMSYTGLIKVNGHWRLFPKLWRVRMEE